MRLNVHSPKKKTSRDRQSIKDMNKSKIRTNQIKLISLFSLLCTFLILALNYLPHSVVIIAAETSASISHSIMSIFRQNPLTSDINTNIHTIDSNIQSNEHSTSIEGISNKNQVPTDVSHGISQGMTHSTISTVTNTTKPKLRTPKLLYMTASYTMDQFEFLEKSLDSVKDICNSGWDVTINIQVSNGLSYSDPKYLQLQEKLYCEYMKKKIQIVLETYGQIGFGLNSRHRLVMQNYLNEFDYFVFAEEDMILTPELLSSYLEATLRIKTHLPRSWLRYYIGFLRYEESAQGDGKVTWEYQRDQVYGIDLGELLGQYVVTLNMNQALFILSRSQVKDLHDRCGYLTDIGGKSAFYHELRRSMNTDWKGIAAGVSEWSSSYQHIFQCGMKRIIPANNIESFMIYHSSNKGQSRRLRSDLIKVSDWNEIVKDKLLSPTTLDTLYNRIIFEQFSLNLIDKSKLKGKSKWSYELPMETPV